jgi:hypothetical protein
MTFWQAFKATYSGSIAFLIACPLLALVPVAFELLQHAIEVRIGFYDSIAAAKATEHHPMRMAFGLLKVMSLTVPVYWITRFLPERNARFAATADLLAIRLFTGYFAIGIALAALQLFALPQTGIVLIASLVIGQIVGALLIAWGVAATFGNVAIGPRASIRIMARQVPWTFAFTVIVILPLMIPHYALGAAALFGPKPLMWPILIVDSLLVSWLTAVIAGGGYYAAMRGATEVGINLIGTSAPLSSTGI